MKINADRSLRVQVDTASLPWTGSPAGGVERRMLERDGEEVARATSLVRFAPGCAFPEHEHGAGEEFLVLDGVFSDEEGDFPAGFYVRNPPGSRHSPASQPGCTILVKLRQMRADDRDVVRIDTGRAASVPLAEGVREIPLFTGPVERVRIPILAHGAHWRFGPAEGGVEMFLLAGAAVIDGASCASGTWLRAPAGEAVLVVSEGGCRAFVKTGHLAPAGDAAA